MFKNKSEDPTVTVNISHWADLQKLIKEEVTMRKISINFINSFEKSRFKS